MLHDICTTVGLLVILVIFIYLANRFLTFVASIRYKKQPFCVICMEYHAVTARHGMCIKCNALKLVGMLDEH